MKFLQAALALCLCTATLSGCDALRNAAGLTKKSPDEFAVTTKAPLVIPPDFNLRPPRPGAPPSNTRDPSTNAEMALFANADPQTVANGMAGNYTPGEKMLLANATAQNQSFHQETVRGFEGGLKFNLADPKLTGDVTAYHYGFYGLQLTAFDAADTSYFTQNAGSASQTGFEANLQYRPIPPLQLHTSVGYNSAYYTSFPGSQCWAFQSPAQGCAGAVATGNPLGPYKGGTQNLTGQPLSRAPEWSVLAGATYTRPLNDRIELSLSGDLRYSSGYFLEPNNSPYAYQPGYVTVDASVRLTMDSWEFAVIGRNLGNTYYATIGLDKPLGPVGQTDAFLGDPRTVRLQVTKRF